MLYFVTNSPAVCSSDPERILVHFVTANHDEALAKATDEKFVIDRNSIKSLLDAAVLASACNEWAEEKLYTYVDKGSNTSPRYDVVRIPQVGDAVSYSFNGDTYPCGKITSVSADKPMGGQPYKRIVAKDADGSQHVFFRLGLTGSWRKDKTWSLVSGHHNERNPSF